MAVNATDSNSRELRKSLCTHILPKLRPFQREAVEFAVHGTRYDRQWTGDCRNAETAANDVGLLGRGKILLADDMGCGKTVTALAIMAHYEDEWPLLILCPSSLRYMWPAEIEKFFPSIPPKSIYVVSGFQDIGFAKRSDIKVVIMTYSLLQNRSAVSHVLKEQNFQCIIADESHNLKQKNSQRTQLLMPVLSRAKRLLLLSGTPALARPVELWTQLACLAPQVFGNWTTYTRQYCNPRKKRFGRAKFVWDLSGSSNEEELHAKLKCIMVRRLKCDVLSELPQKQRSLVPVPISSKEKMACKKAMAELNGSPVDIADILEKSERQSDFQVRQKLMLAYQQTGIGKAEATAEYILDWLNGSESQKILVFAHHKTVLDTIDRALLSKRSNSHIRIDGSVSTTVRGQLVRKFQTCARVRVGLLSMTAAGVGLTLTAASTVLFAELHWTPGVLAQAEDRAHRIGQTHDCVQIIYMVCKDKTLSLDMTLWKMLGRKISTLNHIVDGNKDAPYLYQAEQRSEEKKGRIGRSGHEELVEFFAGQSEDAEFRKAPAKGSLQSFFSKVSPGNAKSTQNHGAPCPISLTRTNKSNATQDSKSNDLARNDSWVCETCTFKNRKTKTGCIACGTPSRRNESDTSNANILSADSCNEDGSVRWSCSVCTFENAASLSTTNWYTCEMCTEPFVTDSEQRKIFDTPKPFKECTQHSAEKRLDLNDTQKSSRKLSYSANRLTLQNVFSSDKLDGTIHVEGAINLCELSPSPGTASTSPQCATVIEIDLESPQRFHQTAEDKSSIDMEEVLRFSVSKNSGRITLHFAQTRQPSCVNFDVEDIITRTTADTLLDARIKRVSEGFKRILIEFDRDRIDVMLAKEEISLSLTDEQIAQAKREIEEFVSNYLELREVEKKAIKDSGADLPSKSLGRSVAQLMLGSNDRTTIRYIGGAKERALENQRAGCASEADLMVLQGNACAWCAVTLSAASRAGSATYCSQECAEEGRLKRGGMYSSVQVRAAVFALEGGKCTLCGIGGHSLFEQIQALQPSERLNKLLSLNWTLPKSSKALENLLQRPKEGDFWQVDHIRAVVEGGGGCGLDNLRTLCVPCHRIETEKLRGRMNFQSPVNKKNCSSTELKRKQVDIRTALFGAQPGRKKPRS